MEALQELFRTRFASDAERIEPLPLSGSHRRYFRLGAPGCTAIGVVGTDPLENRAFVTEARHFRSRGIAVPEIYAVSDDGLRYLQEDLGSESLFDLTAEGRRRGAYSPEEEALLQRAIAGLPRIQFEGARGLDFSVCYPDAAFNARMIDFDLNYFKYCFLLPSGLAFREIPLQDDFDRLKADLLQDTAQTFLYRDFQARNVMIRDNQPWYIDFQGGRRGPVWYDVASFLYQARARYPQALKDKLLRTYLEAAAPYGVPDEATAREQLRPFVLLRTLQVLGAYGFRGNFERKPHFLESIPYALASLREILQTPLERYPYLDSVLRELSAPKESASQGEAGLLVHIYSFSYRRGIPPDTSDNGGGFVFDCRGLHNPGRYERFRERTGRDRDVIEFLEQRGEVQGFLEHVYGLVDPTVERYLSRSFDHLQVCFGCTGGQHRSVYCAEALATHLKAKYPVRVRLTHREQNLDRILP